MNDLRGPRKELCAQRAHLSPGTRLLPLRTDTLPAVGPRAEWEDLRNRPHVLALDYSGTSSPCQDLESTHLKSYRGAHRRLIENLNQRLTHSTTPEAPVTVTARRDYVRAVRPRYAGSLACKTCHPRWILRHDRLSSRVRPDPAPQPRAPRQAAAATPTGDLFRAGRHHPRRDLGSRPLSGRRASRRCCLWGCRGRRTTSPSRPRGRSASARSAPSPSIVACRPAHGGATAAPRLGRLLKTASPSRPPMGRSRPRALPRGAGSLTPATPPTEASSRR